MRIKSSIPTRLNVPTRIVIAIIATVAMLAASIVATAAPGDLDPSFGSGGMVVTQLGANSFGAAAAVVQQSDGMIVAAGIQILPGPLGSDFALARYDRNGVLDPAFGSAGIVTTDFSGGGDGARAIRIQADGKLLVAGFVQDGSLGLARYDRDGSLDASFGSGGIVVTSSAIFDAGNALVLQRDAKIVILSGSEDVFGGALIAVLRYNADGSVDSSFGDEGRVLTDFGSVAIANALALQSDDKLVVAGWVQTNSDDFALVRYNPDGTLDGSFGMGGRVTTDFAGGSDLAFDLSVQPDGKLLVTGYTWPAGKKEFSFKPANIVLARYNADGSLDDDFGDHGAAITDIGGGDDRAHAIVRQEDGKIVVAGSAERQFVIARYDADGSPDLSFGGCGRVTTDFPGTGFAEDTAYALIAQADGKLVAAGETFDGAHGGFALARYESDGAPFCPPQPSASCVSSVNPTTSFLSLTDASADKRDDLTWKLHHADLTTLDDFGDPLVGDTYALCIYEESAVAPRLVFSATAPPAQRCRRGPCWRRMRRNGFLYMNHDDTPCGLQTIRLRAGRSGRADFTVHGRGPRLALPRLPLNVPVRVQLRSTNGHCWQTLFSTVTHDDGVRFEIRSQ